MKRLLIANRGEIAIRVFKTARDLGIETFGIYPEDDSDALHVKMLPSRTKISGEGAAAYLDIEEILSVAKELKVDAIHPGYGFLSESAEFASRCEAEGILFVGPTAQTLSALSDKSAARALAVSNDVSVLKGINKPVTANEAERFFSELSPGSAMFIKAIAGGGGRGMRLVTETRLIQQAFESAEREARAFFGCGDLYVEQFMPNARHIEVQILGDGEDAVHFAERECSLQRRNQKIIEMAPAQDLSDLLRKQLYEASIRMARSVAYKGLGTFEFLVSKDGNQYALWK